MAYRLSFEVKGQPRHVNLRGTGVTVGRDQTSNDVHVPAATVSREHAVFRFDGRGWPLEDRHSTNGTQVNGRYLQPGPEGAQRADDGDTISLGTLRMELRRIEGTLSDVDSLAQASNTTASAACPGAMRDLHGLDDASTVVRHPGGCRSPRATLS